MRADPLGLPEGDFLLFNLLLNLSSLSGVQRPLSFELLKLVEVIAGVSGLLERSLRLGETPKKCLLS